MVTKYCKNNIPVNIHVLISKNDIVLLPPSIQNIELSHNRLIYKGCDFITYKEMVNNNIDLKLKNYALIVGKLMQEKGYRGVLGIDSIIYDNDVYFMEINPRFQNSSTVLNKALQENNLPSLQELHYNCFYDKSIKLKKFDVNYSSYINEYGALNKEFKISPIEILDKFEQNIEYEEISYSSTYIYDKPIF
jgi:predicted ATP-grasp superfamily ATP-dependent carboligase